MKNMSFFLLYFILFYIFLESVPFGVGVECGQTWRGRSGAFIFHSNSSVILALQKCFGQSFVLMFI